MSAPWLVEAVPPDCTVWLDGVRYADGSPGHDGDPVALAGLTVLWGRSTLLDQPAPASCTFRVLDAAGGQAFRPALRIGAPIEVRASAIIYPDPTVSVADDPGFETVTPPAAAVTGGTLTATGADRPAGGQGARSLAVDPAAGAQSVTVTLPPRVFTPDPAGWDSVPRTAAGQAWTVGVTVWSPAASATLGVAGVAVLAEVVAFDHPSGGPGTVSSLTPRVPVPGDGWRPWSVTVTPPPGVWLGVRVVVSPTGPAWSAVPAETSWDDLGDAPAWRDLGRVWLDELSILAPAAGAARDGVVFAGWITDLVARYERDPAGATVVDVTAQDVTAEMDNRLVGGVPWPAESAAARAARIVADAARPATTVTVDASIAGRVMSWRDSDVDGAATLLRRVAQSAGGVLWCVSSIAGPTALRVEDLAGRPPMATLVEDAGGVVRIVLAPPAAGAGVVMDACDPLLDPVEWVQDSTDVATTVAVDWSEQTVDDEGQPAPTGRTVVAVDADAVAVHGTLSTSIATDAAVEADAAALAAAWLGRLSVAGWRIAGLTWPLTIAERLDAAALDRVMSILDMSTRIGLPVLLTNLPAWSPVADTPAVALYLDGGRFVYDVDPSGAGVGWTLELLTVDATAVGRAAIAWQDLPVVTPEPDTGPWTWDQFDESIEWDDLAGVDV